MCCWWDRCSGALSQVLKVWGWSGDGAVLGFSHHAWCCFRVFASRYDAALGFLHHAGAARHRHNADVIGSKIGVTFFSEQADDGANKPRSNPTSQSQSCSDNVRVSRWHASCNNHRRPGEATHLIWSDLICAHRTVLAWPSSTNSGMNNSRPKGKARRQSSQWPQEIVALLFIVFCRQDVKDFCIYDVRIC